MAHASATHQGSVLNKTAIVVFNDSGFFNCFITAIRVMSDLNDTAQEKVAFFNSAAISHFRKPEPDVKHSLICLFCGDPVTYPRRWCDANCRDDWEKENAYS